MHFQFVGIFMRCGVGEIVILYSIKEQIKSAINVL